MHRMIFASVLIALPVVAAQPWKLIHTQGVMNFVYMEPQPADNDDQYRLAIGEICAAKAICQVLFWNDESLVPRRLPMTDAQIEGQVMQWSYNANTGLKSSNLLPSSTS
jgi:hypothetical protein